MNLLFKKKMKVFKKKNYTSYGLCISVSLKTQSSELTLVKNSVTQAPNKMESISQEASQHFSH